MCVSGPQPAPLSMRALVPVLFLWRPARSKPLRTPPSPFRLYHFFFLQARPGRTPGCGHSPAPPPLACPAPRRRGRGAPGTPCSPPPRAPTRRQSAGAARRDWMEITAPRSVCLYCPVRTHSQTEADLGSVLYRDGSTTDRARGTPPPSHLSRSLIRAAPRVAWSHPLPPPRSPRAASRNEKRLNETEWGVPVRPPPRTPLAPHAAAPPTRTRCRRLRPCPPPTPPARPLRRTARAVRRQWRQRQRLEWGQRQ